MGILNYKTLEAFYQDYTPGLGFPKLLMYKRRFSAIIGMIALAPDSIAVIYQSISKAGKPVGQVFVSDSMDKLYPIYVDL